MGQAQDRRWEINLEVDDAGAPLDRQFDMDVQQAMAECAAILLRLGGAVQSYVIRQEDPGTSLWFPVKAVFKWQSFVPGIRPPRREPAAPVQQPSEEELIAAEAAALDEPLSEDEEIAAGQDGEEMVSADGNAREVVPFEQVQARLRDGWQLAADVESGV